MRIVHIGNVVGDSYMIVKALRAKGIEADLVIDHNAYVMEHPQWIDADFDDDVEEWSPRWEQVSLKNYKIPAWVKYANLRYANRQGIRLKFLGLDFPIERARILRNYNAIAKNYDLVQACYLEPVNCYLSKLRPYIAYSKGSDLREVPFEGGLRARLAALAYQKADHVFITNPDSLDAADRLRISKWTFMPFIIDHHLFAPRRSRIREELESRFDFNIVIAAPARHDWFYKGNNELLQAYAQYVKSVNPDAILLLVDWGVDKERSKGLVKKLGVEGRVVWFRLMNRRRLAEFYNAADIIFDHSGMPSFGTTQLEGLACAKPVMAKLPREDLMKRCYSEPPPFLDVSNEREILLRLGALTASVSERERIGKESRHWLISQHDAPRVVEEHIKIYEELLSG